jgi:hypothetical protein
MIEYDLIEDCYQRQKILHFLSNLDGIGIGIGIGCHHGPIPVFLYQSS